MTTPPAVQADFPYGVTIATRWNDNDMHGHVNNVEYYSFFDTAVTLWLVTVAGHDVRTADVIGLCVESQCVFLAPVIFPEAVDARIRVAHVGRSSVQYEVALFGSDGSCAATGRFVHVYVDRSTRRPCELPESLRTALSRLAPPTGGDGIRGSSTA